MGSAPADPRTPTMAVDFTPSRAAGLARLETFAPAMGTYARQRNHDLGPDDRSNVSALSPWVRHRLLHERELVEAALERFAPSTVEKFVQEVCWRTYFKGWLEHRPAVWQAHGERRDAQLEELERSSGLRSAYEAATAGRTGIACFDAWATELVETGYLHNHARMWFASIWLFTLGLPLELGADFFLRHLLDGDPASNTLSWRWVGGLHTRGKTYLARRSNIRKYTDGRFDPEGLAAEAPARTEPTNPSIGPLRPADPLPEGEVAMLLTEEDLHVTSLCPGGATVVALAGAVFPDRRSPLGAGELARAFAEGALADALDRGAEHYGVGASAVPSEDFLEGAVAWAKGSGAKVVVTGETPTGWVETRIDALQERLAEEGLRLVRVRRSWDRAFWPHASKGFFKLKKAIPSTLRALGVPHG